MMWQQISSKPIYSPKHSIHSNLTLAIHISVKDDVATSERTEIMGDYDDGSDDGLPIQIIYFYKDGIVEKMLTNYDHNLLKPDTLYKFRRPTAANPLTGIVYNSRTGMLNHYEWVD